MEIRIYPHAGAFLEENLSLLEREEAANNLMLGLALGMERGASVFNEAHFWGIKEKERPVFCALQTPPRNLLVYGEPDDIRDCTRLMYESVIHRGIETSGVFGPEAVTLPFVETWFMLSGQAGEVKQEMGVFRLEQVVPPVYCGGHLRPAVKEDQELAERWMREFYLEAMGEAEEELCRKLVEGHLSRKDLFIWESAGPVSMAAATRPTRNGISVNAVYTPPEHRGKGYASNCVAQLSQRMLDSGYRFCALFTDLSNPTSNKIYQAVGYQKMAEFLEVRWMNIAG